MDDPKLNYNNQNKTSSKQNLVGTGILDTGASLTCLNAQFEKYIFNRGPGGTVEGVNGMTTIQVKGEVHMYFLSTDPGTPGSVHTIPVRTHDTCTDRSRYFAQPDLRRHVDQRRAIPTNMD